MTVTNAVKALVFDVFGTCVDWRGSVIAEGAALSARTGLKVDWAAFADAWRAEYQPSMQRVRSGGRPWTVLDILHRESLEKLVDRFGLSSLSAAERDHLNLVWHRLQPWPDTVPGLTRLKRRYLVMPLSNGNFVLLAEMAKSAGLPWDGVLSAELFRHYKPQPAAYLGAVELLGLEPGQVMMVAAHNDDLKAAATVGLRTGFVCRPAEHGPGQTTDLGPTGDWDVTADHFLDLADKLGA